MAFWKRKQRAAKPESPRRDVTGAPLPPGEINARPYVLDPMLMPDEFTPKLDESKTRVYDDEVDPDWRDPITEADDD